MTGMSPGEKKATPCMSLYLESLKVTLIQVYHLSQLLKGLLWLAYKKKKGYNVT